MLSPDRYAGLVVEDEVVFLRADVVDLERELVSVRERRLRWAASAWGALVVLSVGGGVLWSVDHGWAGLGAGALLLFGGLLAGGVVGEFVVWAAGLLRERRRVAARRLASGGGVDGEV